MQVVTEHRQCNSDYENTSFVSMWTKKFQVYVLSEGRCTGTAHLF